MEGELDLSFDDEFSDPLSIREIIEQYAHESLSQPTGVVDTVIEYIYSAHNLGGSSYSISDSWSENIFLEIGGSAYA